MHPHPLTTLWAPAGRLTFFRQCLDGINFLIDANGIPTDMARRLREYVHQQKDVKLREYATSKALPILSPALRIEVAYHCHRHLFDSVGFLYGTEESFIVRLAMLMTSRTLAPQELAPNRNLYIIHRGLILYGGRVLSSGMTWGDDVILRDPRYFLPFLARAMSFVDLFLVSRDNMLAMMEAFPISSKKIRRKQIYIALRRHMIREAKSIQDAAGLLTSKDLGADKDFLGVSHVAKNLSDRQARSINMAVSMENKMEFGDVGTKDDMPSLYEEIIKLKKQQEADQLATASDVRSLKTAIENLSNQIAAALFTDPSGVAAGMVGSSSTGALGACTGALGALGGSGNEISRKVSATRRRRRTEAGGSPGRAREGSVAATATAAVNGTLNNTTDTVNSTVNNTVGITANAAKKAIDLPIPII